ncbi:putative aryl-alcohol dehydrogenase [Paramyrothecium foliicola]|nr:putative aryl-alcohol dehydrogenase [Paramyrothecium foliicola]
MDIPKSMVSETLASIRGVAALRMAILGARFIPAYHKRGMGLTAWDALDGRYFKPKCLTENDGRSSAVMTAKEAEVSSSKKVSRGPKLHWAAFISHRKVEDLKANIEALGINLSPENIDKIESGYELDIRFPHNLLTAAKKGPQARRVVFNSNVMVILTTYNSRRPSSLTMVLLAHIA